jgi:hypothetical protein
LTSAQIQSYLNHISKTREDWQVEQAEAALKLYGYYLSSEPKTLEASVEKGHDIWTIQELLRHENLQTTMIYTHVAKKNVLGV